MRIMKVTLLTLVLFLALNAGAALATDSQDVELTFTGRTMFQIHYDTSLLAQDFSSYILVEDPTRSELNFNPRDTRIGFTAVTREDAWTYRSVFEIDFYGTNAGNNLIPRLRHGYAEAVHDNGFSLRGGQDWLPIAQQNPGTVDFGILSWGGNLWWRVPQFTVRYQRGKVGALVSIAKHRNSNDQEIAEDMPWVMGRVEVKDVLVAKSVVAIGGGFRSVTIDGHSYDPSIVCAEFKLPLPFGGIVVNGEAYTGQGLGRSFVHYGLDYNPDHADGARDIASVGGFVSVKVPVMEKVDVNFGYGVDNPEDEDIVAPDQGITEGVFTPPYKKNSVLFANVKYRINKRFGTGVELTDYETIAYCGKVFDGQRFTFAWWFVF